ncbi:hypothetical protein GCM10027294_53230 [Marinactinospora endophytica]
MPAEMVRPLLVLGGIAVTMVLLAVVWLGGTVAAWASGAGWNPPPFEVATLIRVVRGHDMWPGADPGWVRAGMLIAVVVAGVVAAAVAVVVSGRRAGAGGLARRQDVAKLASREAVAKAQRLRPSLRGTKPSAIPAAETGFPLGAHDPSGVELRGSWEDVALVFMGPRAGKTSAVAGPAVLDAPGACLVTSNKSDIYALTSRARARRGRVWLFDPQSIAHAEQDMWWDMLASARTLEGADRLAMHLINAAGDARRHDFWAKAGRNTLKILLHAAALEPQRGLVDVLQWLADPADPTPVDILNRRELVTLADNLEGTVKGAQETRDGIYEHARQAVSCLLDPAVLAWVCPDPFIEEFDPRAFASSRDTLYLLSKDGGGSAAGVIAALTDACMRAGVAQAEACAGGRLDPPMLPVLDEAANVCRIEDLPALYSHLGSRGITPITVLQSYEQAVMAWGDSGAKALWSAATIKLMGPGLDDYAFADRISHLIGLHYVTEASVSYGSSGRSVTQSRRRERILDAADVRELAQGSAILFATSMRPARVRLRPWYEGARAGRLGEDKAAVEAEIVERAGRTRA